MKFQSNKSNISNNVRCIFCETISHILGKRIFMFLLGRRWNKIHKKDIEIYLAGLQLQFVGGLNKRGWTVRDIDVIGNHNDVAVFNQRVKNATIKNPVHYCGSDINHSHTSCLWNGIKLIFGKDGF